MKVTLDDLNPQSLPLRDGAHLGVFETPLRLPLNKVTKKYVTGVPDLSVMRVLESINLSRPLDISRNGIFTTSGTDIKDCFDEMNSLVEKMEANNDRLPRGLAEIEKDNAKKVINASGQLGSAYFMDEKYPWIIEPSDQKVDSSVVIALSTLFRKIADNSSNLPVNWLDLHYGRYDDVHVTYKKGSSYGIFPYVPGSSKDSALSLAYHGLVNRISLSAAKKMDSNLINLTPMQWREAFLSTQSDCSGGLSDQYDPDVIMLLRRARPLSNEKKVPLWTYDSTSGELVASQYSSGVICGSRNISAVPAFINITYTGIAKVFSLIVQNIPGLHVGHQILSPHLMRDFMDAKGGANVGLHVEDISGYDNSCGMDILMQCDEVINRVFSMGDRHSGFIEYISQLDIVTRFPGVQGKRGYDNDKYSWSRLAHKAGISSGFQGTTLQGTMINLMIRIHTVMKKLKISATDAINYCANFIKWTGTPLQNCIWGVLLKGDDIVIFYDRNKLQSDDFKEIMSSLSFATDVEPGPIFLMQYIDTGHKQKGSDFFGAPESLLYLQTFRSFGLIAKRLGARRIFTEHPLLDVRPARYAIMANLTDTYFHPYYREFSSHLLSYLNKVDDDAPPGGWSLNTLKTYTKSPRGISDMVDYAKTKGKDDPFLKEVFRRSLEYGGASVDVQYADQHWSDDFMDMIKAVAKIRPLGLIPLNIRHDLSKVGVTDDDISVNFHQTKKVSVNQLQDTAKNIFSLIKPSLKHEIYSR